MGLSNKATTPLLMPGDHSSQELTCHLDFGRVHFANSLHMPNATPTGQTDKSPITLAIERQDDFTNLPTFGCHAWVRPPGKKPAKLKAKSQKGMFLGCIPWHDPKSNGVKTAAHAGFNEGRRSQIASIMDCIISQSCLNKIEGCIHHLRQPSSCVSDRRCTPSAPKSA